MTLKYLLAHPASAFVLAGLIVSAAVPAHADTYAWTDWSTSTSGLPGSATGYIGSTVVTYSGQTTGITNTPPSWNPTSSYAGGPVGNTAPQAFNALGLDGGTSIVATINFSSPVVNPVFSIFSLGGGGITAQFDFNTPFTIVATGPSAEFGGGDLTEVGNVLYGDEGNGTIMFTGTFTSISFTNPVFENYFAFTVGEDAPLTRSEVPEPETLSLLGLGLAALPFARRSLSFRRA